MVRETLRRRAISDLAMPFRAMASISASRPRNFDAYRLSMLCGRPMHLPSRRALAIPSFVLEDMSVRSSSAVKEKAKARTLEGISLPKTYRSLTVQSWILRCMHSESKFMIMKIDRPRRDNSEQMRISPDRIFRITVPNRRCETPFVPVIVSLIQ